MPPNHVNATWTNAHDEALIAMLAIGLSRAEIASKLNERFDTVFTRCAVGGRAHRLKLATPSKPKPEPKKRVRPVRHHEFRPPPPRPREVIVMQCEEIVPRNLTLLELEPEDCRFPIGHGPFVFCGLPKLDGGPYCINHAHLCRQVLR